MIAIEVCKAIVGSQPAFVFANNPTLKVDLELIYAHMIFLERYREDFPVIEKYFG